MGNGMDKTGGLEKTGIRQVWRDLTESGADADTILNAGDGLADNPHHLGTGLFEVSASANVGKRGFLGACNNLFQLMLPSGTKRGCDPNTNSLFATNFAATPEEANELVDDFKTVAGNRTKVRTAPASPMFYE